MAAKAAGMDYPALVNRIAEIALERRGKLSGSSARRG